MEYTLEEIYALVGKEDKTAGLTLKYGSEAHNTYGQFVTVVFLYSQKEREHLDQIINEKPWKNHGYVKARYLGLDLLEDNVTILNEKGINSKDITEILYFQAASKNTFHSHQKREIDKIEVPVQQLQKGRDLDWMYGFKKKQVLQGIGLSPKEKAFFLAGRLYYELEEITVAELEEIHQEDGKLDVKVEWELLKIKHQREEITDEEKKRLAELYGLKKKEASEILDKYLQEAGSSLKKLIRENLDQAAELFEKVIQFKERRLTVLSKNPIYLDLDSYLHIYMRHVEEFKVSPNFENKSNFQWNEGDVFLVIGSVVEGVENEYDDFRINNPDKRYSRYGNQSMYYQGDYYTFHIEIDGRISTFHKTRKEHEKK